MGPQKIELPEDIELTLVYETEEGENKYIGIGKHIDDAEYNYRQLGIIQFGEYDLFIFDKSYSSVDISLTVPIRMPLGNISPSPLVYT